MSDVAIFWIAIVVGWLLFTAVVVLALCINAGRCSRIERSSGGGRE